MPSLWGILWYGDFQQLLWDVCALGWIHVCPKTSKHFPKQHNHNNPS